MFCRFCGKQMEAGSRFCPHCGADNTASGATPTSSAPYYSTAGYGGGVIKQRSVATAIILSILTCGIYGIYWFVKLTDETNYATGEAGTSGGTAFLLTLLTCGIYSIFWTYKQGEKLDRLAQMRGQAPSSRGILYLILSLFGFGIIAYALMQDSLNKLA